MLLLSKRPQGWGRVGSVSFPIMAVRMGQVAENWNPGEQLCVMGPSLSSCLHSNHLVSATGDLLAHTSAGTAGSAKRRAASQGERHYGVHTRGSPEGTSKAQCQTQQPDAKISQNSYTNRGNGHLARRALETSTPLTPHYKGETWAQDNALISSLVVYGIP